MPQQLLEVGRIIHSQLSVEALTQIAIDRGEGILASNGALSVCTGPRTGRSPKDRFIVNEDPISEHIDWGKVNQPTTPDIFEALWDKAITYLKDKDIYHSKLSVGADEQYRLPLNVYTEKAWHNIFAKQLFIRDEVDSADDSNTWTILNACGLSTDPDIDHVHSDASIVLCFSKRRVLICGTQYAGEMKKAMFTVMNFLMPEQNVLPMHCAANVGQDHSVCLFFGLSGTGKTTLSADPKRKLIGDDEHGWGDTGVFNFEGGCYAKCIKLSHENEPLIWDAIKSGTVLENVVLNTQSLAPNFDDDSLTENTRAAYPREHIVSRIESNRGQQPSAVIFLTCDLYGVLPPVALLDKFQAAYYFLSGYTAKIAGTEVGQSKAAQATFSNCFGAAFFPRPPKVYAELLMDRIDKAACPVYLVNTGWAGGAYGQGGKRYPIPVTRAIVEAIQNGALLDTSFSNLPGFEFKIPNKLAGVNPEFLDPRKAWNNKNAYYAAANQLIEQFKANFIHLAASDEIVKAGPNEIVVAGVKDAATSAG